MAKPFIGIKQLWYGSPLTSAQATGLTNAAAVASLIAAQDSGFTEIKNVHEGTWGYSQDDPSVTDYINELTGQPYYRDKTTLGNRTITFTIGVRFLTDYLAGDVYFHTACADHNLVRCRTQFKMVKSMEDQAAEYEAIVRAVAEGR